MNEEGAGHCEACGMPDEPVFGMSFVETAMLYGAIYVQELRGPSKAQLMDEIERRELFVGKRHIIPGAIEAKRNLVQDMRAFLVACVGEEKVLRLESDSRKTLAMLEGN